MGAFVRHQGFWNKLFRRYYRNSREWQLGKELLRRADPHSLPIPLANQLRSPDLRPDRSIEETQIEEDRKTLVRSVVSKRSDLIRLRGESVTLGVDDESTKGRLLLYTPDETGKDGASEYASLGFFNQCDAPPWDTWIAYSDRTLLAWVPTELVGLAQRGIDDNPLECIAWFSWFESTNV